MDNETKSMLVQALMDKMESAPKEADEHNGAGDELYFTNAKAVGSALEQCGKDARYVRATAEYVADSAHDVSGTASEYYNLVVGYRGMSDYRSAFMVAKRGLELHPFDVDLLGVAISSALGCAQRGECERFIERAEKLGRDFWSDKLYTAIILYLRDSLGSEPGLPERALSYASAYEKAFPFDDVAYNLHAEILLRLGRTDEATAVLEGAINGTQGPDGNSQAVIVAPQCCLTYIDEVLSGKAGMAAYQKIIQIARKGIEYSAQERERANMGYFLYRDAEAQDALICSAESEKDGFGNEARVRDALRTYRCAFEMLPVQIGEYRDIIRKRYLLLTSRSGITDMPLVD